MQWVTVSKHELGEQFYPVFVLGKALKSLGLGYSEAAEKPNSYWRDKCVLFHIIWNKEYWNIWEPNFKRIAKYSKFFCIEFDADKHPNYWYKPSMGLKVPFVLNKLRDATKHFIWEMDLAYNPFLRPVVRFPLRVYETKWEEEYHHKDIDFFGLVGDENFSVEPTLLLLQKLEQEGYTVCPLVLNKTVQQFYDNNITMKVISNEKKFSPESIVRFNALMLRSKVFIDLGYNLTTGRTVYDALFRGAICVGSDHYGAQQLLFPEFAVNPRKINMPDLYSLSKQARRQWSDESIERFRQRGRTEANVQRMVEDLNAYINSYTSEGN